MLALFRGLLVVALLGLGTVTDAAGATYSLDDALQRVREEAAHIGQQLRDSKRAEDKLKLMRQDVQNLYSLAKGTAWEAAVPYIINARVAWILFTIRMERTGQRVVAAVKPWVAATHAQALQLHFTNVEAVQEQVVARLPERLREAVTRLHVQQGLFLVYSGLAAGLLSVMLRRIA
ncbi:hypothetical protein CHLRE_03g195410v5 [Chlamydomonas reinhardtii]|uniref:Uncharacterized protein n=1 Tax=Chlamydomonas reinhardtii TaxID=3055 RepID=A0A2K3DYM7_CHLRE|nr:uncharacterized protein CHLRE_03g195410v5 [Chlamydomonas reinhardtii]PNW85628.1 hypothetical protein CHLRE_03g195410v5 [Chlamydomonas reinhardtii]